MITLYNSLSRSVEPFVANGPVTMYVCGPTVYAAPHIGNARPAVVFDVLFRLLKHVHGEVIYARNFTDVDDKIIEAANASGQPIGAITDKAIEAYLSDMGNLLVEQPSHMPRATSYIERMQAMVALLVEKGHAYQVDGEVFFHVPSNRHPTLSGNESLRSGERVEVDPRKKDPRDFVLWKPAKPGEPSWVSPWGHGRPGWHIECSAMIKSIFGDTIDIHAGGADLRFPHHEAEMAQSHCANDAPLARFFLHNGLLTVDGRKMAKSVGNVIMLSDLLTRYPGESVRYAFLQTHYRSPLNWTETFVHEAHRALTALYEALDGIPVEEAPVAAPVIEALSSDLNTPLALSELTWMAAGLRRDPDPVLAGRLLASARLLGLLNQPSATWLRGDDSAWVDEIIALRNEARVARDFAKADRLRDDLLAKGIVLTDTKDGTRWSKTT